MTNYHNQETIHFTSVTLLVRDLSRSIEFYQHILKLIVTYKDKQKIGFGANPTDTIIHLVEDRNALEQDITLGLYHFALLLPSRTELARVIRQLSSSHYPITGASDHGVSEAIYLDDPDGNGIEIYVDKDPSIWTKENQELSMVTLPLNIQKLMNEDDQKIYDQIHENTILGHIHLHVDQLEKASSFYSSAIGFKATQNYMQSALFLSDEGYHHHIGLNTWHQDAPLCKAKQVGLKEMTLYIPKSKYISFIRSITDHHIPIFVDQNIQYIIDPYDIKIVLYIEA
ncbi:MAG: VOC family protein [Acholeplasmataceae bacterium]|nr:VOC family protein [Acholeplasmataceae bacterium]